MKIPKKQLVKWKALRYSGDVESLASALEVSTKTISRALNHGECSLTTLEAISKFYTERETRYKAALS